MKSGESRTISFDLSRQRGRELKRWVPLAVMAFIVPAIFVGGVILVFAGGFWFSRPHDRFSYVSFTLIAILLTAGVAVFVRRGFRIPTSISFDGEGMTWTYGPSDRRSISWKGPKLKVTVTDVRAGVLPEALKAVNEAGSISIGIGSSAFVPGECIDHFLRSAESQEWRLEERTENQGTSSARRRVIAFRSQ